LKSSLIKPPSQKLSITAAQTIAYTEFLHSSVTTKNLYYAILCDLAKIKAYEEDTCFKFTRAFVGFNKDPEKPFTLTIDYKDNNGSVKIYLRELDRSFIEISATGQFRLKVRAITKDFCIKALNYKEEDLEDGSQLLRNFESLLINRPSQRTHTAARASGSGRGAGGGAGVSNSASFWDTAPEASNNSIILIFKPIASEAVAVECEKSETLKTIADRLIKDHGKKLGLKPGDSTRLKLLCNGSAYSLADQECASITLENSGVDSFAGFRLLITRAATPAPSAPTHPSM
jgi:hypothetical protein